MFISTHPTQHSTKQHLHESLNVKIFQSAECNSWGLIASGFFPPPVALSLILSIESKSRLISPPATPGRGIVDISPLRTSTEGLLAPGPPRDDWTDLERAFCNSAFRSVTDACGNVWSMEGKWEGDIAYLTL